MSTSDVGSWHIQLGQSLLRISDPESVQESVFSTERYQIIFNGEIYNSAALRNKLLACGIHFDTGIDTEVFLRAWDFWGAKCLPLIEGMFAVVIYDKTLSKIHLARDRFGEKPLYLMQSSSLIAFSSEMKSFMRLPVEERPLVDYDFLVFAQDPTQTCFTPLKGVTGVIPGEIVTVELHNRGPKVRRRFWFDVGSLLSEIDQNPASDSPNARLLALRKDLVTSLQSRISDSILWSSELSGGVDSSLLAMLTAGLLAEKDETDPVKCNFQGFASTVVSEATEDADNALRVANHLGIDLDLMIATPQGITVSDFVGVIWALEDPWLADSHLVMYRHYRALSERGIRVSISGNGADELFFGYSSMFYELGFLYHEKIRRPSRSGNISDGFFNEVLGTSFPTVLENQMTESELIAANIERLKPWKTALVAFLGKTYPLATLCLKTRPRPGIFIRSLVTRWVVVADRERMRRRIVNASAGVNRDDIQIRLKSLLIGPMPRHLRFMDRLAMAHGIEIRQPYLSPRVIGAALSMTGAFLWSFGWTKFPLRALMQGHIPDEVIFRQNKLGWHDDVRFLISENRVLQEFITDLVCDKSFDQVTKNLALRKKKLRIRLQVLKKATLLEDWRTVGDNWDLVSVVVFLNLFSPMPMSQAVHSHLPVSEQVLAKD